MKTKNRVLIGTALLLIAGLPGFLRGAIPAGERAALIALYESTGGDNWIDNAGWKTPPLDTDGFAMPGTESSWHGIRISEDHVTRIELSWNGLSGTIPSGIAGLTGLTGLFLDGNQLEGAIPQEIYGLTGLQYLYLNDNQLSGTISTEIGGLTGLRVLSLYSNGLTGGIPAEIGSLTGLGILLLYDNQLTGEIPPEIGNLTDLTILSLYSNLLSGTIPDELAGLTALQRLFLDSNQLTGSIPSWIGNFTHMQRFRLGDNQLTGGIPVEIGNLTDLTNLNLSGNLLTGSIPAAIGNLTNLQTLALGGNQFTGTIPDEIGLLLNLTDLSLDSNQLTGPVPASLGALTRLQYLALHSNKLSGSIPAEIGNLAGLSGLLLYDNELTGSIPPEIGGLTELQSLYLYDNLLTGSIPSALGNLTGLETLLLNVNRLTGPIPATIGNLTALTFLSLASNSLSGAIPSEIGALTGLTRLYLESNRLSGAIPVEMVNLGLLTALNIGYNCLTAQDAGLIAFLDEKDPDWAATQCLSAVPLRLTAPNGGEIWEGGSTQTVRWTTDGFAAQVKLEYSLNGGTGWTTIAASIPNSGGYDWTVPFAAASNCLIRISEVLDANIADASDAVFTITVSAPLTVLSPAAGEVLVLGSIRPITWFVNGVDGLLDIYLYKGSASLGAIAVGIPARDGSYSWKSGFLRNGTRAAAGNSYRIRLVSRADSKIRAFSDASFSLVKARIAVKAPGSGTVWKLGGSQRIAWAYTAVSGTVDILLYRNGALRGQIASGIPVGDLGYSWTAGALASGGSVPGGTGYQIMVKASADKVSGRSAGTFTLKR